MKERICVFTGSRAEYGLLYPLLKKLVGHPQFRMQLLVSGMHLSSAFGNTYRQIEKDGFRIDAKVSILSNDDSPFGIARATAKGMEEYAKALSRLKPSLAIVLGDRFEAFAFASAAYLCGVPIAHLHGGETTEGATDEGFRHAITKFSTLHFTSSELYRKRVIQLGEAPSTVYNVGAIGLDNIRQLPLLTRSGLAKQVSPLFMDKFFLVTYHPLTLNEKEGVKALKNLLRALDKFPECNCVFTLPNADAGNQQLTKIIKNYVEKRSSRASWFVSLGQLKYLSAMKYCSAVVGNSSSGMIEAPSFGVPTVNIGDRQKGRIAVSSIIQSGEDEQSIEFALKKAISRSFSLKSAGVKSPYGKENTANKILKILENLSWPLSRQKSFYDLK